MSQYENLTAPILAGTQCNWALLGTLTLQVYKFHVSFPQERAAIKALVYTIFLLEVAQTALTSHFAYATLVLQWGDPNVFVDLPWSSLTTPIFTAITSVAVQLFFAWRIHVLRGGSLVFRAIIGLIVLLALMQGLAAIVSDSRFAVTTQISEITRLMVGVKVWLFGSAVCDVVITVTMVIILSEYRTATPWKGTDSLITKLIYNTVETGAVTSIVAVADVVLFITLPSTNLHQWPAFMLGKLYSNVLLVTLNARGSRGTPHPSASLSGNIHGNIHNIHAGTELQWRRNTNTADDDDEEAETPRTMQKVHISTTTRVTRDGDDTDRDNKSYTHSPL
ncbi:hypothetical protein DFH08DRAFT_159528 [Mycena albidolilacea]|uniref:DUF6534 domain-containing protein n=1 Tax=Mycena albidolilacea TaxID=1033008 RepID=A0AAD7EQI0_9AGAR|nr:hypothetical protein DFH08DRAFT_159528 [Mycena albidolilacea]